MYMCAGLWDNDLVNRKEEQMKPIEVTKQGVLGHMHASVIRHDTPTDKVFLAGVGLDLGCGSSRGVSGPETAALDRIEMPMN